MAIVNLPQVPTFPGKPNSTGSSDPSSSSAGSVFGGSMTPSSEGGLFPGEEPTSAESVEKSDTDKWIDYYSSAAQADYAFNHQEAEYNRQWQEMMSNTAYQRMVNDLKEAGLNPWLALQGAGLGGASTGSGATASSNAGSSTAGSYGDWWTKNKASNILLLKTLLGAVTSAVGIYQNGMDKTFGSVINFVKAVLPFAS